MLGNKVVFRYTKFMDHTTHNSKNLFKQKLFLKVGAFILVSFCVWFLNFVVELFYISSDQINTMEES